VARILKRENLENLQREPRARWNNSTLRKDFPGYSPRDVVIELGASVEEGTTAGTISADIVGESILKLDMEKRFPIESASVDAYKLSNAWYQTGEHKLTLQEIDRTLIPGGELLFRDYTYLYKPVHSFFRRLGYKVVVESRYAPEPEMGIDFTRARFFKPGSVKVSRGNPYPYL